MWPTLLITSNKVSCIAIRLSLIHIFSSLAMQIYLMIDTVMLGFMSSFYELGIYSSAIKYVRILMPIMTSLGMVMLPRLSYCNNIGNVCLLYTSPFDREIFWGEPRLCLCGQWCCRTNKEPDGIFAGYHRCDRCV